jgi:RNA polymerase sigma factor (sigma-70 family)
VTTSSYRPENPGPSRRTTRHCGHSLPVRKRAIPRDRRSPGTLLTTAFGGDDEAWNALVRQLTPALRRAARGFRLSETDIDDAVQGAWIRLLTSGHTIEKPEAIAGWLATCTRREALRSRQRHVEEILVGEWFPDDLGSDDSVESTVLERESQRELLGAINRLSGRQRALLLQIVLAPGRSYADIAEVLDMPVGAIGPTRERGLERLRDDPRVDRLAMSC